MGKRSRRVAKVAAAPARETIAPTPRNAAPFPDWWIYVLLFLATFAVYSQVRHFDFINFDDPEYVGGNIHVRAGVTWSGVKWAFTSTGAANWFPLTWLSHMAAYQLFGLASGWHHLVNVLIHALASLLLFAAFRRMTGALWRSAVVAFLFALHPLHVESVAWVAERKDVLCAFFWFLTLWCYARYVERPTLARYIPVLLAFCGGLMSKSMIVTLPCVLLLLDVWPLRRALSWPVIREKLPLFALSAGASFLTFISQRQGHAVRSLSSLPLSSRLANAVLTYVVYIGRMIWPAKLAVYYPYSHRVSALSVMAAAAVLVTITILAMRMARTDPYLAVGWFWYLGTLVPVIGLIQVGGQSSADRYMYEPAVGLAIMLCWGAAKLTTEYPAARRFIIGTAAVACSCYLVLTWIQASYWSNSGTLFQHAVDVTNDNYIADNNLADYYLTEERNEEARGPVLEALRLNPNYPEAHINLGTIYRRTGQMEQSEREYQAALAIQAINADAHTGYGALLLQENRYSEALREFQKVVELRPESATGHYDVGRVLAALGRSDQAMEQFSEAIRLEPDHAEAHHSLGVALATRGRLNEAIAEFRAEASLKPDDASIHNYLGMLLVSVGRLDEAAAEYSAALKIKPDFDAARRGLAALKARR